MAPSQVKRKREKGAEDTTPSKRLASFEKVAIKYGSFLRAIHRVDEPKTRYGIDDTDTELPVLESDFKEAGKDFPGREWRGLTTRAIEQRPDRSDRPTMFLPIGYKHKEDRETYQKKLLGRQFLTLLDRRPGALYFEGIKYKPPQSTGIQFNRESVLTRFCQSLAKHLQVSGVVPQCEIPSASWKALQSGSPSFAFVTYPDMETARQAITRFHKKVLYRESDSTLFVYWRDKSDFVSKSPQKKETKLVTFAKAIERVFTLDGEPQPECIFPPKAKIELLAGQDGVALLRYASAANAKAALQAFGRQALVGVKETPYRYHLSAQDSKPDTLFLKPLWLPIRVQELNTRPMEGNERPKGGREFLSFIESDFQVNDVIPICNGTKATWECFEKGESAFMFITYPSAELADDAIRKYNDRLWPFNSDAPRRNRLQVTRSQKRAEVLYCDGIFVPEVEEKREKQSEPPMSFPEALECDFKVQDVLPKCRIPEKNFKYLEQGESSYVFLEYPSTELAEEAIRAFQDQMWPFDQEAKRRHRLKFKISSRISQEIVCEGVFDPLIEADPRIHHLDTLCKRFASDFKMDDVTPSCFIPNKSYAGIAEGNVGAVYLAYPTRDLASKAISSFNSRMWPFDAKSCNQTRLIVLHGKNSAADVRVDGLYDVDRRPKKNSSVPPHVREYETKLAVDFALNGKTPSCAIPEEIRSDFENGKEFYARFTYPTRYLADDAIRAFDKRHWPFDHHGRNASSRPLRLRLSGRDEKTVVCDGLCKPTDAQVVSAPSSRRLLEQLELDFTVNGTAPQCEIPLKNQDAVDGGKEAFIFFTYPTIDIAEEAVRLFRGRSYPFDSDRSARLNVKISDKNPRRIYCSGIFRPSARRRSLEPPPSSSTVASSSSKSNDSLSRRIELDFTIRGETPQCGIPLKSQDALAEGNNSFVFLQYTKPELASEAISKFNLTLWPFDPKAKRRNRLDMQMSEKNPSCVFCIGVFDPKIVNVEEEHCRKVAEKVEMDLTLDGVSPICTIPRGIRDSLAAGRVEHVLITYKSDSLLRKAIDTFQNKLWPFGISNVKQEPLRLIEGAKRNMLKVHGVFDYTIEAKKLSFPQMLERAFTVDGHVPLLKIPRMNEEMLKDGQESFALFRYPTPEVASEALRSFLGRTWPFGAARDVRTSRLATRESDNGRVEIVCDGIFDPALPVPKYSKPHHYRELGRALEHDFEINGFIPVASIPHKSWDALADKREASMFLSYGDRKLADEAIRRFEGKLWPFNDSDARPLRVQASRKTPGDVMVMNIYDILLAKQQHKQRSVSPKKRRPETLVERLESDLTINGSVPKCNIPPRSWDLMERGDYSYVFVHYPTPEVTQEAMRRFFGRGWPFNAHGRRTRLNMRFGESGNGEIMCDGIFDPSRKEPSDSKDYHYRHLAQKISCDFEYQHIVPIGSFPVKSWSDLADKRETLLFLSYGDREVARHAADSFHQRKWPFHGNYSHFSSLDVEISRKVPGDVKVRGIFDPSLFEIQSLTAQVEKDFSWKGNVPVCDINEKCRQEMTQGYCSFAYLRYPNASIVPDIIREFNDRFWPFDREARHRNRICMKQHDSRRDSVYCEGIFDPAVEPHPDELHYRELAKRIEVDFKVDHVVPLCMVPRKEWTFLAQKKPATVYLSYGRDELARAAIRRYNNTIWHDQIRVRMEMSRTTRGDVLLFNIIDILLPVPESKYYVDMAKEIEPDFRIDGCTPECTIPKGAEPEFAAGRLSYVFLSYPSDEIATRAVQRFDRTKWPNRSQIQRQSVIQVQRHKNSGEIRVFGLFDAFREKENPPPPPAWIVALTKELAKDFEIGKTKPECSILKKSWEELECHVESRVHLSYPTIALADQALSEFNGKSWPFETKRLRESTLTVQRGDKGHELQVYGIFLKEYSEKPVEDTLERQLQMDFTLQQDVPWCDMPTDEKETIYLTYPSEHCAKRAVALYHDRTWPFRPTRDCTTRQRLRVTHNGRGGGRVKVQGIFDYLSPSSPEAGEIEEEEEKKEEKELSNEEKRWEREFTDYFHLEKEKSRPECHLFQPPTGLKLRYPTMNQAQAALDHFTKVLQAKEWKSSLPLHPSDKTTMELKDQRTILVTELSKPVERDTKQLFVYFGKVLSHGFQIKKSRPVPFVSKKSWKKLLENESAAVHIEYESEQVANEAMKSFQGKKWPFEETKQDKIELKLRQSTSNPKRIYLDVTMVEKEREEFKSSEEYSKLQRNLSEAFKFDAEIRPKCTFEHEAFNILTQKSADRASIRLKFNTPTAADQAYQFVSKENTFLCKSSSMDQRVIYLEGDFSSLL